MENENCYKVHYVAFEAETGESFGDYEVVYAASVEDAKLMCAEWMRKNPLVSNFKITFVADEEGNVL